MATHLLRVKVKPNARASSFKQSPEGTWLAGVKSPPVDGKANQELIALVAATSAARSPPCRSGADHRAA
jgi:uncharacterized protein YggU (UPF0235/DUF167 family)